LIFFCIGAGPGLIFARKKYAPLKKVPEFNFALLADAKPVNSTAKMSCRAVRFFIQMQLFTETAVLI